MSTSEQPQSQPLTRRQLRELRNTASTPIITLEQAEAAARGEVSDSTAEAEVITDSHETVAAPADESPELELVEVPEPERVVDADETAAPPVDFDPDAPVLTRRQARERERLRTASVTVVPAVDHDAAGTEEAPSGPVPLPAPTLSEPVEVELPVGFDAALARDGDTTGSISTANALILSQTPEVAALTSPVAATGEIILTGSLLLPDSFGATGSLPGTADGKDVDEVLLDGELPATSSPTPVAASSAVSTIKSADDVIKPPTPDKSNRLMLALVITSGALALALIGAIIAALVTGAFQ